VSRAWYRAALCAQGPVWQRRRLNHNRAGRVWARDRSQTCVAVGVALATAAASCFALDSVGAAATCAHVLCVTVLVCAAVCGARGAWWVARRAWGRFVTPPALGACVR
jgi:hypothetical protein